MRAPTLLFVFIPIYVAAIASLAEGAEPPDLEVVAREVVRNLVDGKYDAAVARFAPDLKKSLGRDQLANMIDALRTARSPARSVIPRLRRDEPDGNVLITVKGNWSRGGPSDFRVRLSPDGAVVGLALADEVKPEDELARDRYEEKAHLRLPFHGTATARNVALDPKNPHFGPRATRHAIDFVMVEGGKSYRGTGKANEDYLAFGRAVLAPADGTVKMVVDGIADNAPGQKDVSWALGNAVVLDLGQGEFALLAHLEAGIAVKPGQLVKAGETLGKIGNSGAATEPMLHFQLLDKARIAEGASLPSRFSDVLLDGKRVARAAVSEGSRVGE